MAAFESTKFIPFVFPPSNPRFCNNDSLLPAKTSRFSHLVSNQRIRGPAASFSLSGSQVEVGRYAAARVEGRKRALTASDDESDDDFPSLEELTQAALRPKISTEASKTGPTFQRLEQPALQRAVLQFDQAQLGPGGYPSRSRDQPVILDNDDDLDEADAGGEANGVFNDVDTGRIERDAGLHRTFATSELASAPTESIDASGSWFDVEEPALGLRPHEQHVITSTPAQAQPQTLPQSSAPQQDQANLQGTGSIAQSALVQSTLHSLPKILDSGDDGWADEDTAELEKELGLDLREQQVESLSTGTPTSPGPRSAEAPQDEIQSRERRETTDTSAQGLEWEHQEETLGERGLGEEVLVGEAEGVKIQQQKELAGQRALGGQQNVAEVDDTNDPMDKEITEALPTTQLEIESHHFRLRGIRTQQPTKGQAKTTRYRVVWGEHLNRFDSWVNEDDVQISIPRLPRERSSQNLDPQAESDVRVYRMRRNKRSKDKKTFEYLVDKLFTWITEDQLRISPSPTLLAQLKVSSIDFSSPTQSEVYRIHLTTPINDEPRHIPRTSRSPSTPASPADPMLDGKPATRERGHQDRHTKINKGTHRSGNTDDDYNTSDTNDDNPRSAKRRKLPTSTNNALTPDEPTLIGSNHHHTLRTSRSPSVRVESAPAAEYQEWPFQGFLKHITIGNQTTYNLEFTLPRTLGQLNLSLSSEVVGAGSGGSATKATASDRAVTSRKELTKEQEDLLAKMVCEDKTWIQIERHFPDHTLQSLKENSFTKQGGKPRRRGRKPGVKTSSA